MARTINWNERKKMRYFGDTIRAWYVNPLGVPFHKDFSDGNKMEEFNARARSVGTKIIGFASIAGIE